MTENKPHPRVTSPQNTEVDVVIPCPTQTTTHPLWIEADRPCHSRAPPGSAPGRGGGNLSDQQLGVRSQRADAPTESGRLDLRRYRQLGSFGGYRAPCGTRPRYVLGPRRAIHGRDSFPATRRPTLPAVASFKWRADALIYKMGDR